MTDASTLVADITAAADKTGPYFLIVLGIVCFIIPGLNPLVGTGIISAGLTKLKT